MGDEAPKPKIPHWWDGPPPMDIWWPDKDGQRYVRADIADGYREALHKARAFMMRQSNDAHERGTAWQLAPEGNTVANEIEEALAKGDEGDG